MMKQNQFKAKLWNLFCRIKLYFTVQKQLCHRLPLSLWNSSLETASAQESKYFCSVSTCLHRMSRKVSISASFSHNLCPFWPEEICNFTVQYCCFNYEEKLFRHDIFQQIYWTVNFLMNMCYLEGGCGCSRQGTGCGGERQHGTMTSQTCFWTITGLGLWSSGRDLKKGEGRQEKQEAETEDQ